MGKLIMSAAIAAGTLLAVPAWADHDRSREHRPVVGPTVSVESMKQKISDLGYELRRLKAAHGYYEAHVVEKKSGGAVKAHFDMKTGELVRAEPHHDRHHHHH